MAFSSKLRTRKTRNLREIKQKKQKIMAQQFCGINNWGGGISTVTSTQPFLALCWRTCTFAVPYCDAIATRPRGLILGAGSVEAICPREPSLENSYPGWTTFLGATVSAAFKSHLPEHPGAEPCPQHRILQPPYGFWSRAAATQGCPSP